MNWIKKAIKKPGSLRATATRMGLLKKGQTLSASDLSIMSSKAKKTGNTKLKRRIALARTLKKMRK
jgi:hypothetical protein